MKWPSMIVIVVLPALLAGGAVAATDRGSGLQEGAPGLELTITISEDTVGAAPTESAPGTAQLRGTVTVQMPSLRGATVTLTSSTDIGWVSMVEPDTMVLDSGQVGEFSITVVVPQGSPAALIGTVMVYGRAVASGLQTSAGDTATITVRPYYRVSLEAQKREVEITPGGTARFMLRVTNAGNSVDSFDIQLSNRNELEKQGWKLEATTSSLAEVHPGEYRTRILALTAPASLVPFKNQATTVSIRAVSLGAQEQNTSAESSTMLSVKEVGSSTPGVALVGSVAVLVAAGAVLFWHRRRRARAGRAPPEIPQTPDGGA